MKIIRFMYDNWFDASGVTLTASTADVDFPVSNIQHPWWTRHWRSTSKTSQWVKWEFASSLAAKAFMLKGHNFSGGHIHLQGNATDSWGSPTVDWVIDIEGQDIIQYMDSTFPSLKFWRVDMESAMSDDAYFKIGRIYSGTWWSPANNFDNIYRKRLIDTSEKVYSTGGQMSANVKQKLKELVYQFSHVTSPDNETFESIFWDYIGQTTPYWICQDADDADKKTMYVENISDWEIQHEFMETYFSLVIAVRECA